jgi:hypothetical protein
MRRRLLARGPVGIFVAPFEQSCASKTRNDKSAVFVSPTELRLY